eukprot:scaffold71346_cov28-Tisochrysis_lutea.AAC.4
MCNTHTNTHRLHGHGAATDGGLQQHVLGEQAHCAYWVCFPGVFEDASLRQQARTHTATSLCRLCEKGRSHVHALSTPDGVRDVDLEPGKRTKTVLVLRMLFVSSYNMAFFVSGLLNLFKKFVILPFSFWEWSPWEREPLGAPLYYDQSTLQE